MTRAHPRPCIECATVFLCDCGWNAVIGGPCGGDLCRDCLREIDSPDPAAYEKRCDEASLFAMERAS